VRRFECFTADLYRLADWLKSCGVNTVAMQSYRHVLRGTMPAIASTGAMLTVGHEAPFGSWDHTGKEGNSRQVSGTSDASKTQLGLTVERT
jgi:hypothetical protein